MELQGALDAEELATLLLRWDAPPLRQVALTVDDPFLTGNHQLLTSAGRRAEICYVMHQGDPARGLLLHIKTYYPEGAYRLPTGGIMQGEGVVDTLGREIYEETGLILGNGRNEVRLERLLGVLAEMAREAPDTLDALAGISGVGGKKLQAYGDDLLRVLADQL